MLKPVSPTATVSKTRNKPFQRTTPHAHNRWKQTPLSYLVFWPVWWPTAHASPPDPHCRWFISILRPPEPAEAKRCMAPTNCSGMRTQGPAIDRDCSEEKRQGGLNRLPLNDSMVAQNATICYTLRQEADKS